ncbi:MAG TPA: hypothetical protein IAB62_10620 [Candidatus Coprocola pullicola]|nr:hypothetical protein [Candidatus Coprocola pullicola]
MYHRLEEDTREMIDCYVINDEENSIVRSGIVFKSGFTLKNVSELTLSYTLMKTEILWKKQI